MITPNLEAETRLRRKIDLHIVPIVAIIYLFCFIDRANIGLWARRSARSLKLICHYAGNARLAGFEKDLNITGYGYNQVISIFYISYIIFEIPSNLVCKWAGPG